MVYKFFDKKSAEGSGVANNEIKHNLKLVKELHKPIIRNFKKGTVYSRFKNNIWGADLADMQLINKLNKGFRFLLCIIVFLVNILGLFLWKTKKGASIVNAFQKISNDSARKPNKMWVDKGSEFYNNSSKKWLKDNDNKMCLIHIERKFVVAEGFIKTLKSKIYK